MVVRKVSEGIATGTKTPVRSKLQRTPAADVISSVSRPTSGPTRPDVQISATPQQPQEDEGVGQKIKDWINKRIDLAVGGAGLTPQQKTAIAGPGEEGFLTPQDFLGVSAAATFTGAFGGAGVSVLPSIGKGAKRAKATEAINRFYRTTTGKGPALGRLAKETVLRLNPKSWSLMGKVLAATGVVGTAAYVMGNIGFGYFQINEGIDSLDFAKTQALKIGDYELARQLNKDAKNVIINAQDAGIGNAFTFGLTGAKTNLGSKAIANEAWDSIIDQKERGLTISEGIVETQEKVDAIIRKRQEDLAADLVIAQDLQRQARASEREEEALFWAEYARQQEKFAAEERERIAEFWLEYRKAILDLQRKAREDTGRSTLGFGLLG